MTITKIKPPFPLSARIKLKHWLRDRWETGALRTATSGLKMTEKVIEMMSYDCHSLGSPLRVDVEQDFITDFTAPAVASGARVKALVIFDGKNTYTTPLSVTQSLVRLDGKAIYLSHSEGAPMLLDAILDHVEAVLAREEESADE